jgi:hypothetical protein
MEPEDVLTSMPPTVMARLDGAPEISAVLRQSGSDRLRPRTVAKCGKNVHVEARLKPRLAWPLF